MSGALQMRPEVAATIRWSKRGTCGSAGCKDPECCCALCGQPIGVSEEDPRWDDHDEYCGDCDVCRDQVPLQLFKGEGKNMVQAQFCSTCVKRLIVGSV